MLHILVFFLATPAPDVSRQIAELGNPSWQAREAATQSLRNMGRHALPALRRHSRHPDPEVRARVSMLLDDDIGAFADQLPVPLPCIDCVSWCEERNGYTGQRCPFVAHYLERAGYFTDSTINYPRYRQATWLMLMDLRAAGVPDDVLVDIAEGMVKKEEQIPVGLGGRKKP